MQLRSGSRLVLPPGVRERVSRFEHRICTPEDLRSEAMVASVGDVTTERLRGAGIRPFVEVVDLKTKRGEASFKHIEGSVRVINEAGTISHDLMIEIRDAFLTGRPKRIEVEGEEDLAVIPIIFYAPLNTVVAYGVPDVGMACIRVTPEEKDRVTRMLEMMVNG